MLTPPPPPQLSLAPGHTAWLMVVSVLSLPANLTWLLFIGFTPSPRSEAEAYLASPGTLQDAWLGLVRNRTLKKDSQRVHGRCQYCVWSGDTKGDSRPSVPVGEWFQGPRAYRHPQVLRSLI